MMHRDMMLKYGYLFYLAKYLEHTQKFQCTGYSREVVAPTLNFGTPSLYLFVRARKLKISRLVGICRYYISM